MDESIKEKSYPFGGGKERWVMGEKLGGAVVEGIREDLWLVLK